MTGFSSDGETGAPFEVNRAELDRPIQQAVLALGEHTAGGVFVDYMTEEEDSNWVLLCRSMDMVQDTDLAVEAYCRLPPTKDWATLYLTLFGVLQALVVQQDAVKTICKAIGLTLDFEMYPNLARIREVRNAAIGHPTTRHTAKGNQPRTHGIVRSDLAIGRFTLSSQEGYEHVHENVSVQSLIDTQETAILELLRAAAEHIAARAKQKEESGWKARFPG